MGDRGPAGLALLACCVLTPAISWPGGAPRRERPAGPLDSCLQRRFHDDDARFGMARVPTRVHVPEFQPGTAEEAAAVRDLARGGWEMGVYLLGRDALALDMTRAAWEKVGPDSFQRALSRPVFLSDKRFPDFPRPWEVWPHGREALARFARVDTYEATVGRWSVDARPVRADRAACLKCHADSAPGDALGVLLYVSTKPGG